MAFITIMSKALCFVVLCIVTFVCCSLLGGGLARLLSYP